jgi:hypothetical protein
VRNVIALVLIVASAVSLGCESHGNRVKGRPMVQRTKDLRAAVGKQVTLVGTAREGDAHGAAIDLMGGTVELPTYAWPENYVGHRVMISGTVVDSHIAPDTGKRVYRLGEIQSVSRWSR